MMTSEDLVNKVRELATKYPRAQYVHPVSPFPHLKNTRCFYTCGKVLNGPPEEGCIIAQAARLLDPEINLYFCEGKGPEYVLQKLGISDARVNEYTAQDIVWMEDVQNAQDLGTYWGTAVNLADGIHTHS